MAEKVVPRVWAVIFAGSGGYEKVVPRVWAVIFAGLGG